MDESEFDKFADEYYAIHASNIAISGEEPAYFAEYKIRDLARAYLAKEPPRTGRISILDFGAGVGTSVPFMRKYLPLSEITCLDISRKSLAIGQARWGEHARFLHFDGEKIPLRDASMDVVFVACVFHHIADREHIRLLREFHRVLIPGGMAFIFEHNPSNPVTRRAVKTSPLDDNAKLISARAMKANLKAAAFSGIQIRYRVFFPSALRALRPLEKWMMWLPLGAQYYAFAAKGFQPARSHAFPIGEKSIPRDSRSRTRTVARACEAVSFGQWPAAPSVF